MTTPATTSDTPTHRHQSGPRRWMWRTVLSSILVMLFALGYLFHAQREYQQCVADYLTRNASATHARSDASANTINSLVEQSIALTTALDPTHQPPSDKDVAAAIKAIAAVPLDAAKYNASIAKYPYPAYTCGGTTPGKEFRK